MNRLALLVMLLLAYIAAGLAGTAHATHTDPAGECDVNVSAGTYDLDDYVNDTDTEGAVNVPHYKMDVVSPGHAVICLGAGTHDDSGATTGAYTVKGGIKLRPQPNLSSTPTILGKGQYDGPYTFVYDLNIDGFNTAGGQVTTDGTGTPPQYTRQTSDPTPLIRGDYIYFFFTDVTNFHDDGGASTGGGGICFNGASGNSHEEANVGIYFSRVHSCGDLYRTFDYGQQDDSCTGSSTCRSDIHDHGIYTNDGQSWAVSDNFLYENAARGISIHNNGDNMYALRNVITGNGQHGILFGENTSNGPNDNTIDGNIIAQNDDDSSDRNVSWFCDTNLGTPCSNFSGNKVENNCLYEPVTSKDSDIVVRNIDGNQDANMTSARLDWDPNTLLTATPFSTYSSGYYVVSDSNCMGKDPYITPGPRTQVAP